MPHDRLYTLMKAAQARLRETGALEPVLLIEGNRNVEVLLAGLPSTPDARRAFFYALGHRYAGLHPWRLTSVMDAYLRLREPDEELQVTGSLIDDPKAKDCIIVASLTRAGDSRLLLAPYERAPTLSGVRITFEPAQSPEGQAEFYSLQAFFDGASD